MTRPRFTPFIWFLCQVVIQTLGRYLPVRLEGTHHLPKGVPFILASNHISTLDPLLTCALLMPRLKSLLAPAATKGLFVGPLKWLLNRLGSFQIDRQENRNLAPVRAMLRTLENDPVLIYPEGGIVRGGRRVRGKRGVGFVVARTNLPVVPMFISGSDRALKRRGRWIHRHPVIIRIGPPVIFDPRDLEAGATQITAAIMTAIYGLDPTAPIKPSPGISEES